MSEKNTKINEREFVTKTSREKPESEKNNPHNLVTLLRCVREKFFHKKIMRPRFAELLNSTKTRNYSKDFSDDMLEKIETDSTAISYAHIERYAEFLEVPSGLLFLISRLNSEASRGNEKELLAIADGLRCLSEFLNKNSKRLIESPSMNEETGIHVLFEMYSNYRFGHTLGDKQIYKDPMKQMQSRANLLDIVSRDRNAIQAERPILRSPSEETQMSLKF